MWKCFQQNLNQQYFLHFLIRPSNYQICLLKKYMDVRIYFWKISSLRAAQLPFQWKSSLHNLLHQARPRSWFFSICTYGNQILTLFAKVFDSGNQNWYKFIKGYVILLFTWERIKQKQRRKIQVKVTWMIFFP